MNDIDIAVKEINHKYPDLSFRNVVLDDCDFMNALVDSSAVDLNLLDTVLKPQLYRACCQKKMLELFSQNLIHY